MNRRQRSGAPDYLIIGHITKDQTDQGDRLGGTAVYSAVLAKRMGARVALFTAGLPDLPLDILEGIQIYSQPGLGTTTFKNEYTPAGRVQTLVERATDLDLSRVPPLWQGARIVHLAPIAGEVAFSAGEFFPDSALAYSLQGWMRTWDSSGRVSAAPLPQAAVPKRDDLAAFLSIEDLGQDREALLDIKSRFPLVLFTLAERGAEVHQGDAFLKIDPLPAREVDPTGAGDIFAAAFMIAWALQERSVLNAARAANALAAASVSREGPAGIESQEEISRQQEVLDRYG